ncbi:MAG: GGDEF domain-containing protein [bacterium]
MSSTTKTEELEPLRSSNTRPLRATRQEGDAVEGAAAEPGTGWTLLRLALGALLVVLVGVADYWTASGLSFSLFYAAPILWVAWSRSRWGAIALSVLAAVTWLVSDQLADPQAVSQTVPIWNVIVRMGFFLILGLSLTALRTALDREQRLARVDALTGILNSRAFHEQADREIERHRRLHHPFTAAYLDLDDLKGINDQHGHLVGDKVLRRIARAFESELRAADILARLGGDEFAVLFPHTGETEARLVVERLLDAARTQMAEDGWDVTISAGLVTFRTPPQSVDQLIRKADALMYQAKKRGKNMLVSRVV